MTAAYGAAALFRRPLTLIALVIGLFAMHGMALESHSAHAASATIVAASATTEPAVAGHPVALPHAPAVPSLDEQGDQSPVVVTGALCVAVLLALGLTLLVRRSRGLLVPATGATSRPPHARTAPAPRGPPRDLLAQLCVLRT